ncbi:MAG: Rpn family recombination-promoting nuclease/putative transposase, partial [Thermoguttaceae bacterium]
NIFDTFVKNMFSKILIFTEFLRQYADPKFVAQINLDKIQLGPTHFFGKNGKERIVDLIFRCPLKNDSQRHLCAVIVFEHQSTSLREIPQKLLKYISAIWDEDEKAGRPLSAPYFIVLRTGKKPHKKPYPRVSDKLPKDANGDQIGSTLDIRYDVVDLPEHDWDKLIGLPHLRLVMGVLKKMTESFDEDFSDALMPLREFTSEREQAEWLRPMLDFVSKVFEKHHLKLERETVNQVLEKVFYEKTEEIMLSIFEEAELKGKVEGITLGKAEGVAIGEARALLRVLAARFQTVPNRISDRIAKIGDLVVLDSLTVTAATCKSLDEFENALK